MGVGGSLKEQQELSQATERERPQVKSPPANPPNRNHVQPTTPPNRSGQTHRPPHPRRAQSLLRQRTHLPLLAQLHRVGQISAGLFTLVALAAMLYALVTFHWRAKSIRMRGQGGFDDRFGPTVLAIALLAAVVVNFVLRVTGAGGDKK